jgi:hypothetical protein
MEDEVSTVFFVVPEPESPLLLDDRFMNAFITSELFIIAVLYYYYYYYDAAN